MIKTLRRTTTTIPRELPKIAEKSLTHSSTTAMVVFPHSSPFNPTVGGILEGGIP